MNDVDILLDAIADVESKGTGGYAAKNPKSSASGKYQFMWSQWGNKIREFAKNPNLTEEQFRANPQLQEQYARHYVENVLTPEAKKLQTRHGSKFKPRQVMDLEDAQTLIHFQGYPGSAQYLKTGQTKNLENNKSVKEYLERTREFRNKKREGRKGINMSAKPIKPVEEEVIDLGDEEPVKVETETPETTSQFAAGLRGLARGATFDFADEITAALESAVTGKTYEQAVKESREAYETAAKEYPKTTFGASLVGGAATTLIPGVGQLGMGARVAGAVSKANQLRTQLQAAKAAGDALTVAKLTPIVAEAAKVAAKEVAKGSAKAGAITGGVTGLGAAEDITNLPETALSVGTGAVTGAGLGYAVPRAISAISQTKAGQAAGEALSKAGAAVKERLKSKRWDIPEFAAQPEKQTRVDELVKSGQSQGLTDRQILNSIATEFPEIPIKSLESAFKEKGVKGTIKRILAGSQEAAEFMDRPEQLERAERVKTGQTVEMARLEKGIKQTQESLQDISKQKEGWKDIAKSNLNTLKFEMQDLVSKYNDAKDANVQKQLGDQILALKERMRITSKLTQNKDKLKTLQDISKKNADSVAAELNKLARTRSTEQLQQVAKLRDNLNDQVEQLAKQRSNLVDELDKVKTTDDKDVGTFSEIMSQIKQNVEDNGMGDYWSLIREQAFSGDPRINKVNAYLKYAQERPIYLKELEKFKGGLRPDMPVEPVAVPPPTKGDVVGALITANQKISRAEFGTPLAKVKRNLAEIIQANMGAISPEAYAIQRQLAKTRANVSTIEKSPLFEARTVPITGRTGRVASAPVKFIKTELPDLSKVSTGYKKILKDIGVDIDEIEKTINAGKRAKIFESPQALEETAVADINQQIAQQQKNLRQIKAGQTEEQLKAQLADVELAKEKRKLAEDVRRRMAQEKVNIQNILKDLSEQGVSLEDYLADLQSRRGTLSETESQLYSTLRQTEGIPASIRDVGQAAVIGAKGDVPFGIGKVLLPSPKARIQFVNKIKNRFQNPSLTAAARVALERPITMDVVRSLAMTYKVSEPELIQQFEDVGIPVEMEQETEMRARELPAELQSKPVSSRVERDKYGNYVVRYDDPSIDDEYFTPEQWSRVKYQYE